MARVVSNLRSIGIAALALALAACGSHTPAAQLHPLAVQNKVLSMEIPLARKHELYSVIDLASRTIRVKLRGATLREFPIRKIKIHSAWPDPAVRDELVRKGIADEPQRSVIDPPKQQKADQADTEAVTLERVEDSFEMEDMPLHYSLEFESGAQILVISSSGESLGFFERLPHSALRALFFFKRLAARAPAATVLVDPPAAQALYWTLQTEQKIIIASNAG